MVDGARAVVDLQRQLILARWARQAPWNDCASLPGLVAQVHALTPLGCVLADTEFDSERNHTLVGQQLRALSIIPAKHGKRVWKMHGVRAQMRADFPRQKYCRRALIETVFSVAKRKLSCGAPGPLPAYAASPSPDLGFDLQLYRLWHEF